MKPSPDLSLGKGQSQRACFGCDFRSCKHRSPPKGGAPAACTGEPEIFGQLRELAVKTAWREDVKTALLEALYRIEQNKTKTAERIDAE